MFSEARGGVAIKAVSAKSAQAGHPPQHAFDDLSDTRWAAQGRGQWVQLDLAEEIAISRVRVGFHHDDRDYAFGISTSPDGEQWAAPQRFQSEGRGGVVAYDLEGAENVASLRVTVWGSDANDWANVHTIRMEGVDPLEEAQTVSRASPWGTVDIREWAQGESVAQGVALSLDDAGSLYLTTVRRRKQSSLDIRNLQDLVKEDLSWETVEDRRRFYKEHLTGQRWLPDRNGDGVRDWRDLTVQKDAVVQVRDGDGDGFGEEVRVLDEYHGEVTGIAAGVLAVGSDVFVAVEPDFLRYTDLDHDAFPESSEVVATGLQVHMGQGGHNLSGVVLGPDGRVYWSLADKGHHVVTKEGRLYHRPNSGAIFRCELDGSRVERYSTGERNAQELAFDAHGNLFSMDNDGDYPGEMERALYITEGSEHGWRLNWQWLRKQDFTKISGLPAYNPWMEERLYLPDHETQAAYLTPTIGNFGPGPCGFVGNPGTALSPALADCFFMTNQKAEVRVLRFHPEGAAFRFEELDPIKGGMNNTGLAIGPEGALYAASYGGSRGAVFRFDVEEALRHPERESTERLLGEEVAEIESSVLQGWLAHVDQRVRVKAQLELVRRAAWSDLQRAVDDPASSLLGRLHGIWGLGQGVRHGKVSPSLLLNAWDHGTPEVMAQVAKVVSETPGGARAMEGDLLGNLVWGLNHREPRVAFFCAIALGRLGHEAARLPLVKFLEERGAEDPYLSHAAIMGLSGSQLPRELARLSTHSGAAVRLGAIVALRRQGAAEVRAFLDDADELVLLEAARAIHDDASISEALPDLATLLERDGLQSEALMRRVINAALRAGSDRELHLLESYLARGEGSVVLRRTALASVLWWSQPPVLDPVEGRYRKHEPRDAAAANAVVERLRPSLVEDRELLEVLFNGVIERGEAPWLDGLAEADPAWPARVVRRHLDALAAVDSPKLREAVRQGLASEDASVRERARDHAGKAGIPVVEVLLAILDDTQPAGQGKAVLQLAKEEDPRARERLEQLALRYREGRVDPDWKLELWEAAQEQGISLPPSPDRLKQGGDAKAGKRLVMEHAAAQCVRCHVLPGTSLADENVAGVGPDLSQVGERLTRSELVSSLMQPSASIADGFGTVSLTLNDGSVVAGVLASQGKELWRVNLPDGSSREVKVSEIKDHVLVSTMPPMEGILTPREIRDVVSYLATLKKK